jgi:hypothetical protein
MRAKAPQGIHDSLDGPRGRLTAHDGIPEDAEAVDLDLDYIAWLEPYGRLASHTHPRRSACEDQIAWLECEDLR